MVINGHVIRGTPIAVDVWDKNAFPQAKLFFLSHFHRDHTVGLTRSWDCPIYTSVVTGKLLVEYMGVSKAVVRSLELEEEHLIPLDSEHKEMMSVTLYDANHCPGAVMFLFCGYFGNVLYTGDFRHREGILDFDSLPSIDVLYLDNTYCSPTCTFPSREEAMDATLQKIHACLQKNRRVFLGLDTLGKEDLLKKLSEETHTKIWVDPERRKIMRVLEMDAFISEDKSEAKILTVPFNAVNACNLDRWNSEVPSCAVLATSRFCGFNFKPYSKHETVHVIPFSDHSSYMELLEFVSEVHPRAVVPIIGKGAKGIFGIDLSDRADMSVFSSFLDDSPCADFEIPPSVQETMKSPKGLGKTFNGVKRPLSSTPRPKKQLKLARGVEYINGDSNGTEPEAEDVGDSGNDTDAGPSRQHDVRYVWEVIHISGRGKPEVWHTS